MDFEELLKQAQDGDKLAQHKLGNVYQLALLGQDRDMEQALLWYGRAAEQGHVDAMLNLGMLHADPDLGAPQDVASACQWFTRAAEAGDPEAMFYIGRMLLAGDGLPVDVAAGMGWLERSAGLGTPDAACALARQHASGEHVAQDLIQALKWYRVAAEAGDGSAAYSLGALLVHVDSGEFGDVREGLHWLLVAAEAGVPEAECEAGHSFRIGRGTAVDLRRAMGLYNAAAHKGNVDAQFSIGLMLAAGTGLEGPRPDLAESWYHRAAAAGHAGAAHNLGILHARGDGVEQDMGLAMEYFEHAVSLGNDDAMYSVGLAALQHEPVDVVEAATWALLSVAHAPDGLGRQLLDTVWHHLSPEEADEARIRAAVWERSTSPKALPAHV